MRAPSSVAVAMALAGAALAPPRSTAGEPAAPSWTPDSIPWQSAGANGTRYALLEGRRDVDGGVFTYAFFIPAGVWDTPHAHSTTARVVVLKGALGLGYGGAVDRSKARRYAAGAVVIVPGGATHFDGADVDTVIIGVATGRWSTTYLDRSSPASAGTPLTRPGRSP